jgi:hypothetical protein
LAVLIAGLLVACPFRYAGQFPQNRLAPPHRVSAAVYQEAMRLGLSNAVVALECDGPPMPPIDARAGVAFMDVPFADNPVIYVRNVRDWEKKAREQFPGRKLYQVKADPTRELGFRVEPL